MRDGRKLSREALAIVRRKAVESVISGELTQTQAAAVFGIARATVCQWVAAFRRDGSAALTERPRGRRKDDNPQCVAEIGAWLLRGGPETHELPGSLWNRELVAALLRQKKSVTVSRWTVGRLFRRWGLTAWRRRKNPAPAASSAQAGCGKPTRDCGSRRPGNDARSGFWMKQASIWKASAPAMP